MSLRNLIPDTGPGGATEPKEPKKTWKGKVAKQWRKMQEATTGVSMASYPEGGSIGMTSLQPIRKLQWS